MKTNTKKVTDMKITTLEYFLELASSGSITEASKRLYIAQPTLTKALKQFEEEIGFRLFDRSRDGISLTAEGRQILPQAKQMVDNYHEWLSMGHKSELRSITVCVGRSFSDMLLPGILVKFRQRHPDITINYSVKRSPGQFISKSVHDPVIALLSCKAQTMQQYIELQGNSPAILCTGEFRCLLNTKNPLSKARSVALKDLRDLLLVLPGSDKDEEQGYFSEPTAVARIFKAYPKQPTIHVETVNNVISLVAEDPNTFATSYYPALLRYEQVKNGTLCAVPVQNTKETMLCLFYSKQAAARQPVVDELVTVINREFSRYIPKLIAQAPIPDRKDRRKTLSQT